jgi:hypothetical protein
MIVVDTSPGTVWRIESSDHVDAAQWQQMVTFTNSTGSTVSFPDIGQGGRQPASAAANRFYRLVPY